METSFQRILHPPVKWLFRVTGVFHNAVLEDVLSLDDGISEAETA